MEQLIRIPEPLLLFRHGQATEDPRDGLTLFGPLDHAKPYGVRAGVIGTKAGIDLFKRWVDWVQRPVFISTTPAGPTAVSRISDGVSNALEFGIAPYY